HDFGPDAVKGGVVVGYEARRFSREFAVLSSEVFAANGITAHLFPHLCTTPEVSFAVRHMGVTAGVMITASHNPRTDNGFKFYWSDGGQVVPPHDLKFMELVNTVEDIAHAPFDDAREKGMIQLVSSDVDRAYLQAVQSLSLNRSRSARIVYSPIHGAGTQNVLPVLEQQGFDVTTVPEQREPDPEFPTATRDLINPEFDEVMALPMQRGVEQQADLVIVSDPDADRIGVAVRRSLADPALIHLNGNEVGVALVHCILRTLQEQGKLRPTGVVITTAVTTSLISEIAQSFGMRTINDLLVGYKFIAEQIEQLPDKADFVFAAEESLGYLAGTFVRDKDASIAALLMGELASACKDRGQTVVQYLDDVYRQFGYVKNILHYIEVPGKIGMEQTGRIMRGLRATPPAAIGAMPVLTVVDRLTPEQRDASHYRVGMTGDMLTYILSEDGRTRVTIRPSGTEPKVKCYIQHAAPPADSLDPVRARIDAEAEALAAATNALAYGFIAS
ncbi:MAG: phospho-sugar mutase, partial [Candidatus Kerfeldbacteria bacterium]|nr:phospho-sugar mutase [Candidatus Kerfeldbacteria bacterium]